MALNQDMGKDLLHKGAKLSIKELLIGKSDAQEASDAGSSSSPSKDDGSKKKKKRRFPPAKEMFLQLFPGIDVRRPLGPNNPKPKMVDASRLECFQPKLKKPKVQFPEEAREIIDEIKARRKARNCGASLMKTGSMDMKNLVCTPQKPPKDGVFQIRTQDGEPMLYVEYQNGKMHGVQKKFLNGVLSEIAYYKNGKLHGEMKSYQNGKCSRKFTYKDGALNGPMVQYDKGGEPIMKTNFLNNKQHGICVIYTQGYMISRTSFVNGKKQGMMRAFYPPHDPNEPQRVSKEIFYLDDLMEGPSYTYYPNGKKYMEENFIKNLREGPTIEYYDTGNIRKLALYANNKLAKKPEEYDYYGKKMTT